MQVAPLQSATISGKPCGPGEVVNVSVDEGTELIRRGVAVLIFHDPLEVNPPRKPKAKV